MRLIYTRHIGADDALSVEDWLEILKLLTMWRFARSRQAVLQKLLSIADPVSKIVVWCGDRTLPEKAWLLPSVNELARRSTSLTDHEGSRLGLENVLKMQRISDSYMCKCVEGAESCRTARRCKSRAGYDFSGMTRKEFMKK